MTPMSRHWTEEKVDAFLFRVSSDFVLQLEHLMEKTDTRQRELAAKLGVTKGRVSQVLNNPGNLTLRKMIEYSRALGCKVAVIAYDDGDPHNTNGPIRPQIFAACWEKAGRPIDAFDLGAAADTDQFLDTLLSKDDSFFAQVRTLQEKWRTEADVRADLAQQERERGGAEQEATMRALAYARRKCADDLDTLLSLLDGPRRQEPEQP